MRISDWSSDVCSSDLGINIAGDSSFALMLTAQERGYTVYHYDVRGLTWEAGRLTTPAHPVLDVRREAGAHYRFGEAVTLDLGRDVDVVLMRQRSEEHTSELQSLMRISYAVFCLKKKKNHNQ